MLVSLARLWPRNGSLQPLGTETESEAKVTCAAVIFLPVGKHGPGQISRSVGCLFSSAAQSLKSCPELEQDRVCVCVCNWGILVTSNLSFWSLYGRLFVKYYHKGLGKERIYNMAILPNFNRVCDLIKGWERWKGKKYCKKDKIAKASKNSVQIWSLMHIGREWEPNTCDSLREHTRFLVLTHMSFPEWNTVLFFVCFPSTFSPLPSSKTKAVERSGLRWGNSMLILKK